MLHQVRDRNHCSRGLAFGLRVALPASVLFSRSSGEVNCDSIIASEDCHNAYAPGCRRKAFSTVTPTEPSVVDEATLFSFDDVSIPFTQNLYLSMREPEKYAQNPVVPLGKIGEPDEWRQRRLAARGYQFLCFVCWRVTVSHSWAVSLRRRREV